MIGYLRDVLRHLDRRARLRWEYRLLLGLSDAMLRDIGISRGDLRHAFLHGPDAA